MESNPPKRRLVSVVTNPLGFNDRFDLQQHILDEDLRAFSNIFFAPEVKVVREGLHLRPMGSVIPIF